MVNITIDGKTIEVPEGTTVLQAAREAGIPIPTLCDHPHLTPYGGCRLCLVEVEGARTLQPSCTLPVNNNMVVRTDTPKIKDARKFVLTLIFSERNHFCMYCQKSGGDCELQNCAYAEGMDHWPLQPNWQPYPVDASHPFYVMDHNRCILCRRCVRACSELAGNNTLGMEERGFNTFLVADLGLPLGESSCESCGTCVQVCPTGALIDRKSAYLGHDVQTEVTRSVCVGCSLGCGIEVHTRDNQIIRIDGDWDAQVNGGILCKAGRFEPVHEDRERLLTPMVRKNGSLKAATWDEALSTIAARLTPLKGQNGHGVAALASTRLSAEALYLFRQIFESGMGSQMVTSIEEGSSTAAGSAIAKELGKSFEASIKVLDKADMVLSMGVDLAEDHQVAGFFVKRSIPRGTRLVTVDTQANALSALAEYALQATKDAEADLVLGIAAAVVKLGLAKTASKVNLSAYSVEAVAARTGVPAQAIENTARLLGAAQTPVIVYGSGLGTKTAVQTLKALVELANLTGASLVSPKGKANSVAAAQYGLEKAFELNGQQSVFLALGDDQPSQRLLQKLGNVPFLVVAASFASPATASADVVLPVETWAEIEGHFVNLEGRVQAAKASLAIPEGVKTTFHTLEDLASRLGIASGADWKAGLQERIPAAAIQVN